MPLLNPSVIADFDAAGDANKSYQEARQRGPKRTRTL